MRFQSTWMAVLVCVACGTGKSEPIGTDGIDASTDGGVNDAEDVRELCEEGEPETLTLTVEFPALRGGCPWGEDGNLDPDQGVVTARIEQVSSLELPEDAVVCDVVFDFEGLNGGSGTPMFYDDNFLFTFNDVVLAASYGPMVDEFTEEQGLYRRYEWSALRGYGFEFDDRVPSYCLGEDEDLASCSVPPPETDGALVLSFEPEIVQELAFRAVEEDRYDFTFITIGDNDDTDCAHERFLFEVAVPFVRR